MTRTYAAKRLLEHGPLTFGQLVEITGWTYAQVSSVLLCLDKAGLLEVSGRSKKSIYALTQLD